MLSTRHPAKKFEVVNAAMTGINSHVILPLVRSCEEAHGDVWVIYMGNNEVVGPFGAGTVFGNQATPLPLIHALLELWKRRGPASCSRHVAGVPHRNNRERRVGRHEGVRQI